MTHTAAPALADHVRIVSDHSTVADLRGQAFEVAAIDGRT